MYPAQYFSLFPPFPREESVFVAMSFAETFDPRWKNVIRPAIEEDLHLRAHRVDVSKISNSVLTEIMQGIGNSKIIFADISAISEKLRNANVLYEVGIAHAIRQPEEVVLFRSDDEEMMFDVPGASRRQVCEAIQEAIKEIDNTKNITVKRISSTLDAVSLQILITGVVSGIIEHPKSLTIGGDSSIFFPFAIHKLLELGLVVAKYKKLTTAQRVSVLDVVTYEITELGHAVFRYIQNVGGYSIQPVKTEEPLQS